MNSLNAPISRKTRDTISGIQTPLNQPSWFSATQRSLVKMCLQTTRRLSYLFVAGADLAIEVQRFLRLLKLAPVQQVGADHHASATLPRLAVDGGNVLLVFTQPLVQVLAKWLDELQLGWVVVLERVLSDSAVELGCVIVSLSTSVERRTD